MRYYDETDENDQKFLQEIIGLLHQGIKLAYPAKTTSSMFTQVIDTSKTDYSDLSHLNDIKIFLSPYQDNKQGERIRVHHTDLLYIDLLIQIFLAESACKNQSLKKMLQKVFKKLAHGIIENASDDIPEVEEIFADLIQRDIDTMPDEATAAERIEVKSHHKKFYTALLQEIETLFARNRSPSDPLSDISSVSSISSRRSSSGLSSSPDERRSSSNLSSVSVEDLPDRPQSDLIVGSSDDADFDPPPFSPHP